MVTLVLSILQAELGSAIVDVRAMEVVDRCVRATLDRGVTENIRFFFLTQYNCIKPFCYELLFSIDGK